MEFGFLLDVARAPRNAAVGPDRSPDSRRPGALTNGFGRPQHGAVGAIEVAAATRTSHSVIQLLPVQWSGQINIAEFSTTNPRLTGPMIPGVRA